MSEGRPGPQDDAALVREVATGSMDALAALYDRHANGVHAASARLTGDRQIAEEVVQETFLALWNRAELYDPSVASLAAWLYTIARNRTVDRLRAAGRRPRLVMIGSGRPDGEPEAAALERMALTGQVLGGADLGPGPEDALERDELGATIRHALTGMPEQERTAILLAYRDGLSQSEIAERLGWPLGTVKTRTRRALSRLRDVLGPQLAPDVRPDFGPEAGRDSGPSLESVPPNERYEGTAVTRTTTARERGSDGPR